MILTKIGQHVNEMMAVAEIFLKNFCWSHFLIIRQNANMATNAILNSGLTSVVAKPSTRHDKRVHMTSWQEKHMQAAAEMDDTKSIYSITKTQATSPTNQQVSRTRTETS